MQFSLVQTSHEPNIDEAVAVIISSVLGNILGHANAVVEPSSDAS
jgi:hypothetical protein